MRAGPSWAVQQTLTADAALVLRHSLGLARRRRHAQLTPLHVAAALLSSRPSLLTKACLRCRNQNSPPLAALPHSVQSRALELCFNVALNRLPTVSSDDLLSTQQPVPLSNALVAALKRAQASQRRGCTESQKNQQENSLNVKVDSGQLIISILDDPGVSRVLREAGFSSIAAKEYIEEFCSASNSASSVHSEGRGLGHHCFSFHELGIPLSLMRTPRSVEIGMPYEHFGMDCCEECTSNYEREVRLLRLQPFWPQPVAQDEDLAELGKKWIKLCQSLHQDKLGLKHCNLAISHGTQITYPHYQLWATHNPISFGNPPRNPNVSVIGKCLVEGPNLDLLKKSEGKEGNITLSLGDSHFCGNPNLGERSVEDVLRKENLLRKKLQENVPWQGDKIAPIVDALTGPDRSTKRDIWVLIEGDDTVGKRRLGLGIGESLLGSADSVIHFNMRARSYGIRHLLDEMLLRSSRSSEKEKLSVIMVENVDLAGTQFVKFLEERFETGKFAGLREEGEAIAAVFILTKGDCAYNGRAVNERSVVEMVLKANEGTDHKRKFEDAFPNKIKKQRTDDKEDQFFGVVENGNVHSRKDFSKSFNAIDLNVEADEEDYELEDLSPNLSDLTQETQGPQTFPESIENRFTFNRTQTRDREKKELFFSKLAGCFTKVYGHENKTWFSVEDSILEEIIESSGFAVDSLFDKWTKDIFETSLNIVRISGRGGGSVRLCLGDREPEDLGDGFLGSSLPKRIRITFED